MNKQQLHIAQYWNIYCFPREYPKQQISYNSVQISATRWYIEELYFVLIPKTLCRQCRSSTMKNYFFNSQHTKILQHNTNWKLQYLKSEISEGKRFLEIRQSLRKLWRDWIGQVNKTTKSEMHSSHPKIVSTKSAFIFRLVKSAWTTNSFRMRDDLSNINRNKLPRIRLAAHCKRCARIDVVDSHCLSKRYNLFGHARICSISLCVCVLCVPICVRMTASVSMCSTWRNTCHWHW